MNNPFLSFFKFKFNIYNMLHLVQSVETVCPEVHAMTAVLLALFLDVMWPLDCGRPVSFIIDDYELDGTIKGMISLVCFSF